MRVLKMEKTMLTVDALSNRAEPFSTKATNIILLKLLKRGRMLPWRHFITSWCSVNGQNPQAANAPKNQVSCSFSD